MSQNVHPFQGEIFYISKLGNEYLQVKGGNYRFGPGLIYEAFLFTDEEECAKAIKSTPYYGVAKLIKCTVQTKFETIN